MRRYRIRARSAPPAVLSHEEYMAARARGLVSPEDPTLDMPNMFSRGRMRDHDRATKSERMLNWEAPLYYGKKEGGEARYWDEIEANRKAEQASRERTYLQEREASDARFEEIDRHILGAAAALRVQRLRQLEDRSLESGHRVRPEGWGLLPRTPSVFEQEHGSEVVRGEKELLVPTLRGSEDNSVDIV